MMSTTISTEQKVKQALNLRYTPTAYNHREFAFASLERAVKPCWVVMLGDNCKYWVVCMSDAAKLERAGYEIAK